MCLTHIFTCSPYAWYRSLPLKYQWLLVFMDETYLWEHSAKQYSWNAPGNLRSPLRVRSSKGKRWTVIHAGYKDGWIKGAEFFEVGSDNGEFHGTIDAEFFEEWFTKTFLPSLPKHRCMIIMDNAAFHRKVAVSRSKLTVATIKERLTLHNVPFTDDMTKAELLLLMDEHAPIRPTLETIAEAAGHRILWLPPYFPEFNPIECMWGIIKNCMRKLYNDERITAAVFRDRFHTSCLRCSSNVWRNTIKMCRAAMQMHIDDDDIKADPPDEKKDVATSLLSLGESKREREPTPDHSSDDDVDNDDNDIDDVDDDDIDEKTDAAASSSSLPDTSSGRKRRKAQRLLQPTEQQVRWHDEVAAPGSSKAPALVWKQ